MRGPKLLGLLAIVFLLLLPSEAVAAGRGQPVHVPVSFSILPSSTLTLMEIHDFDSASPATGYTKPDAPPLGTVNFGPLLPGTHIIGATAGSYAVLLEVKSNQPWTALVRATGDLQSGSDTVSLSRLRYAVDDGPAFTPFTTTFAPIKSGGATGGTFTTMDYLLRLMVSDRPGNYGTSLEYKLL